MPTLGTLVSNLHLYPLSPQKACGEATMGIFHGHYIADAIETEIARIDYAVHNPAEALAKINEASQRLPIIEAISLSLSSPSSFPLSR